MLASHRRLVDRGSVDDSAYKISVGVESLEFGTQDDSEDGSAGDIDLGYVGFTVIAVVSFPLHQGFEKEDKSFCRGSAFGVGNDRKQVFELDAVGVDVIYVGFS